MKKLLTILVILLIASITNIANAIIDDTPNSVGLYWDTEANVVDGVNYEPFMTAYVIVTNPTFSTFKAVEMAVYAKIGNEILPMFQGCLYALTPDQALDPRYMTEEVDWYFEPAPEATIPGAMIVLPAEGAEFVELVSVAAYGQPVAKLNGTGVVPTKNVSWSEIKSLYRQNLL